MLTREYNTKENGMQRTLVYVLPEGIPHLDQIRKRLQDAGSITWANAVTFTEDVIDALNPDHIDHPVRRFRIEHYGGKELPVFILEGPDVIEKTCEVVGLQADPDLCDKHSIRAQFVGEFPYQLVGPGWYTHNVAHYAEDLADAERLIQILQDPSVTSRPL